MELLVDLDGLADVHSAVGFFHSVVQLAQSTVAGTGVVPFVGAFFAGSGKFFKNSDVP